MPSHTTYARFAALAAAAAIALAACAPTPAASSSTESPAAQPTQATGNEPDNQPENPPAEVPELLQFKATTLAGADFDGASLLGTPTLLWFWAEWCPICNAEAPLIADALDELPPGVQVLGVPGRSDQDGMQRFVDKHGLGDIVQIVDADGSVWSNFSVSSQPALVIIDAQGNVRTIPGSVGKSGLLQAAESIA